MTKSRYNWKRFWCELAGRVNLSDDGFLVDPDAEYGSVLNPDVVSWDRISTRACLILLGEPGIGKSTALDDEHDRTAANCAASGDQLLKVDLRSYQTDQRLHEHVFESSAITSWVTGTHRLHLFFDSMDEGLMRIDNIGPVLLTEFKDLPVSRLNVRLACRTADWPRGLESQLASLWGEDKVGMYELAPLRRIDVETAAKGTTLSPTAFLAEILRCNVVPLAIKPVTLEFLLNTYKRQQTLPATQAELYAEGCRLLCEEARQYRRPAKSDNDITAYQRLAVASRIAAATIFCNRNAIWTEVDRGDVPPEDIPLKDLLGGTAIAQDGKIDFGESAIWQALNTGLFSSRGSSRLGWSHQTYAEFLAARFLVEHGFTADRIMSLILHEDGKVIPQLHEAAAWLASMIPDLFRRLMRVDAEFLLRSDAATADAKDRHDLVENLLKLFDEGHLLDFDWNQHKQYRKLNHPQLAEQLRPYIRDKAKGIVVRRAAITMAESCGVRSLQGDLVAVSLDSADVHEVRSASAAAILRIGDSGAREALRQLVIGGSGPDPNDDLKGCGLACTWPEFLSPTELFHALTPEQRPNRISWYRIFLRRDIAQHLSEADLPIALTWIVDGSGHPDALSPLTEIADAIAARALDHVDSPAVCEALAATVQWWTSRAFDTYRLQESQFQSKLSQREDTRRKLLLAVLPLIADAVDQFWYLYRGSLLVNDDFYWLLDRLGDPQVPSLQRAIVTLVARMFDFRDVGQTEALLKACKGNQVLATEFSQLLNPVILGSVEADEMKAYWRRVNEVNFGAPQPPLLVPSPQQRIAVLLQKFGGGDLDAFWQLNLDLTLKPNSTRYGDELEPDLTALPGWKSADAVTQDRIISAAKSYVAGYQPLPAIEWIGTNSFPRPILAGYRALLLLLGNQPGYLQTLSPASWGRWAPMTLAYPLVGDRGCGPPYQLLTKLAYENAPTVVLNALNSIIDKENEQHGMLFVPQRVASIWDGKLATALLTKLGDSTLKPQAFGTILAELLEHNSPGARAIANDLLCAPVPQTGEHRQRAIVTAQALIRNTDDAGWGIVCGQQFTGM